MISNRIFENSCDKNHFDKAAPDCNIALKSGWFNKNVKYILSKRRIIWFNPPYSANVKTNVGKMISIFPVTINNISFSTEITLN